MFCHGRKGGTYSKTLEGFQALLTFSKINLLSASISETCIHCAILSIFPPQFITMSYCLAPLFHHVWDLNWLPLTTIRSIGGFVIHNITVQLFKSAEFHPCGVCEFFVFRVPLVIIESRLKMPGAYHAGSSKSGLENRVSNSGPCFKE